MQDVVTTEAWCVGHKCHTVPIWKHQLEVLPCGSNVGEKVLSGNSLSWKKYYDHDPPKGPWPTSTKEGQYWAALEEGPVRPFSPARPKEHRQGASW